MRTTSQSGTNIIELMWFVLIIYGAGLGGVFGYKHFGVWGSVCGVPVGGCVGFLAAFAFTFLVAVICKALFGGPLFFPRRQKKEKP
jgi:hypothetical protein